MQGANNRRLGHKKAAELVQLRHRRRADSISSGAGGLEGFDDFFLAAPADPLTISVIPLIQFCARSGHWSARRRRGCTISPPATKVSAIPKSNRFAGDARCIGSEAYENWFR
jgi:hypothetical protein